MHEFKNFVHKYIAVYTFYKMSANMPKYGFCKFMTFLSSSLWSLLHSLFSSLLGPKYSPQDPVFKYP